MLVEKDEIKNNEEEIAETFNTFFTNIASSLRISLYQDTDFAGGTDAVVGTILEYLYWKNTKTIQVT